jgi:hypothetical protein
MIPKIVIVMNGDLIDEIHSDTHIKVIQLNQNTENALEKELVLCPNRVPFEADVLAANAWKADSKDNGDYVKFNPDYVTKVFQRVPPQIKE